MPEGSPIDVARREAHDAAVERGDLGYFDPVSGLFVMTSTALTERGYCCENGCRHCPYS